MFRRIVVTAALASCVATSVWAQTRATYVLTNGEKHNGVIVYGRGDNNLVDNKFHVNKSGVELVFERADVAVIDFAGGTPSSSERDALPDGTGLMIMRDGSMQRGSLHDIRKGDVVQWVNEAGQRNDYALADVKRLYLNPQAARNTFFSTTGTTGPAAQARSVATLNRNTIVVRVDGNQRWVDTGIDVKRGDRLNLSSSGQVIVTPGSTATPAGARIRSANYPVPTLGVGGLIAKVGDAAPFAVGAGSHQITMPEDGRLQLGINDDEFGDNDGSFSVTIRR